MSTEEKKTIRAVILASSVGTLIEWYDFYIFGALASIISTKFFPAINPTAAYLSVLATFAAGFVVRPFGALVFGRLGDLVGRKYTFLLTLVIMGGSTFAIGLVPDYATIGAAAPILVLFLRLLQGLALGGEYGGAATYVAEHSPAQHRGYYTSWIQTTATLGLFLALGVILFTRKSMGLEQFGEWGWRIPFIVSAFLIGVSIYIRLRMNESPLFRKIKSEGKASKNPLKDSFANRANLKMVLLALFGATMGQGVVWYTGQFYALSFIEKTCSIEFVQARNIILIALGVATPMFVLFGWLSDRIGRKAIMMLGMILAIVTYRPIYKAMYGLADLTLKKEITTKSTTFVKNEKAEGGDLTTIFATKVYTDGSRYEETTKVTQTSNPRQTIANPTVVKELTLGQQGFWMMVLLIGIQVLYVTMVYGPIAAFLVEIFPTRIRYSSMSLPYHIGNGIFGGLTPYIATRLTTHLGDPFAGLWWPIAVAGLCFVIGMIYLSNKVDSNVED
ncbi:MFS transporter [Haliscomenobacter sp.]|uniref:MFS transporter n=1 Tax=Haliscomenobacter sp. TaxID=2717303 RepID=UPI003364E3E6